MSLMYAPTLFFPGEIDKFIYFKGLIKTGSLFIGLLTSFDIS